jgi:hypothetical protein
MQRLQAQPNQDKSCRALIVNQGSFTHRPFNHYRGYEPTTQMTCNGTAQIIRAQVQKQSPE